MERRSDLHIHSLYSDGSFSPMEIAKESAELGLTSIVLTDHDTTKGTDEMLSACESLGIESMPGIELSCTYRDKSIHILGYDMDYQKPSFQKQLSLWKQDREERNRKIVSNLQRGGYDISMEKLHDYFPDAVLTRAHIAVYLCDFHMAPDTKYVFSRLIGNKCPYYVPKKPLEPSFAIRFLLDHGGVPVFAHPILTRMNEEQLMRFTGELVSHGLLGMEGFYSGYSEADEKKIKRIAGYYGLFITGGSDFHGNAKPEIKIGKGKGNLFVPHSCFQDILERKSRLCSSL